MALLLTLIFGSMYGLLHMFNRSMAFDMPQLLATQATKQLEADLGLESIQMGRTDLANSPVPFVMVYDKKSKPLAGSGYIDSKLAQIPVGVVNHATKDKLHAVTWAPRPGIRIASVTAYSPKTGYYVVGGQSLKATESRDKRLLLGTLAAYVVSLAVLALWEFLRRRDRYDFLYKRSGSPEPVEPDTVTHKIVAATRKTAPVRAKSKVTVSKKSAKAR